MNTIMFEYIKNYFKISWSFVSVLHLPDSPVIIGSTEWNFFNAGVDKKNPFGKLYTIEEALELQNEEWRLPTLKEVKQLSLMNITIIQEKKEKGTLLESGNCNLYFPWNYIRKREGFLPHLVGIYWTSDYVFGVDQINKIYSLMEIKQYICTTGGLPSPFKAGVRLVRNIQT